MKFKKFSFQKKIYICCFTLNLILLFICIGIFYFYTSSSLKQNTRDTLISNTSMLKRDLENLLEAADNTLKELQTNQELISIARKIPDSAENYFSSHTPDRSAFQNAFRSVLFSQGLNGSISYVSNYYDNVGVSASSGALKAIHKQSLKSQKRVTRLMEQTVYVSYASPHKDYWGDNHTVFSVIRSMRDTYNQYGLLILDFDVSDMENLLMDFEKPGDYTISILDAKKELVYSSSKQDSKAFYESWRSASDNGSDTFSHNNTSLSCFELSSVTGWTFILTTSTAGYLESMKKLFALSGFLFLSLFIVMSAFLYLVTLRLTIPLKKLSYQLKNLKPGENISPRDITGNDELTGNDEITLLTHAVQGFLSEIYEQNKRLTEARRRTLLAHYDAMEAQLNPHFLYNTLSVIGMAGLSTGNTTVSTMCSELASLLRYSLSYNGQSVLLEQEITNAASYLYIMKMRYEDDLVYEWDLDPALNTMQVPKLILQPLIENCFQHGFHQQDQEILPPWKIHIRSHRDVSRWYLTISNNGADFPQEKLENLYQRIHQFTLPEFEEDSSMELTQRQGFGLENTVLRLNIYYHGEEYFHVDQQENDMTSITIGGPLHPQKIFERNNHTPQTNTAERSSL